MHTQLFLLLLSKKEIQFSSKSCMLWHLCTKCSIFIHKLLVHSICVQNFWDFVTWTDSQNCFFFFFFKQGIVCSQTDVSLQSYLPITSTRRHSQKPCCQIGFVARSGDFPDTADDLNCQKWLLTNRATFSGRRALTPMYFRDKLMWKHATSSGPSTSSGCCHNPSQRLTE